jgi:prophage regulatory protein
MHDKIPTCPSLIRAEELLTLVPYSQNHIRRLEAAGTFPKRLRIGANRVAWLRDEVNDWLSSKMEGRDDE